MTLTVIVLAVGSVLTFGAIPLPLSCTWKVKLAGPLMLVAGRKANLPVLMSANVIVAGKVVTTAPLLTSVPDDGAAGMMTAWNVCVGTSFLSAGSA